MRNRREIAGFQPHHFTDVPLVASWKIQTLELVGLLMHPEPIVYVSNDLPAMDKLKDVPTRALNGFEDEGLKYLQSGNDLYVRESSEGLRMMGAVRNAKQCVECHGGNRGDLLGAFSYRLQRNP